MSAKEEKNTSIRSITRSMYLRGYFFWILTVGLFVGMDHYEVSLFRELLVFSAFFGVFLSLFIATALEELGKLAMEESAELGKKWAGALLYECAEEHLDKLVDPNIEKLKDILLDLRAKGNNLLLPKVE